MKSHKEEGRGVKSPSDTKWDSACMTSSPNAAQLPFIPFHSRTFLYICDPFSIDCFSFCVSRVLIVKVYILEKTASCQIKRDLINNDMT